MTVTTTAAAPDLDEAKIAAFSQRLVDMLSSGALTMMISIGHRTGLFDVMADLRPPLRKRLPASPDSTSGTFASGSVRWPPAAS